MKRVLVKDLNFGISIKNITMSSLKTNGIFNLPVEKKNTKSVILRRSKAFLIDANGTMVIEHVSGSFRSL